MADDLYPVFEIPTASASDDARNAYMPAPSFDFGAGDFVRDGTNRVVMCDGREAYRQWCVKTMHTKKGAALAYIGVGIDQDRALAQPTRTAVQSALARTITEALLKHPQTKRVKDFAFEWAGDALRVGCVVQARDAAAFEIEMTVVTG